MYDAIKKDLFFTRNVRVYVGKIDNKWRRREDNGKSNSRNQVIQQNKTNIFDNMMERARQPYFSMQKREDTRCDILYNDSLANKFVERLVALLWYIDPHRNKLITWSLKLSDIFKELEQYQHNESYNKFYFIGHHKKEQLSHEKLEQLTFYQILFRQNATNTDCYEGFNCNTETSEKYRPTLMAAMENTRAPPAILTNTKVRDIIQCFSMWKILMSL
ncbi:22726_t:CDS:2 [Rhizophagus irregularis]|nr:22726_t:CDS:2 [Rhizophagus irregularis]